MMKPSTHYHLKDAHQLRKYVSRSLLLLLALIVYTTWISLTNFQALGLIPLLLTLSALWHFERYLVARYVHVEINDSGIEVFWRERKYKEILFADIASLHFKRHRSELIALQFRKSHERAVIQKSLVLTWYIGRHHMLDDILERLKAAHPDVIIKGHPQPQPTSS